MRCCPRHWTDGISVIVDMFKDSRGVIMGENGGISKRVTAWAFVVFHDPCWDASGMANPVIRVQ